MTLEELTRLERLAREYRVDFIGELDSREWPENHKATLAHIQELGRNRFDSYATSTATIDEQPWKLEVKHEACRLVESARRCKRRNESSWRYACEPLIFARLKAEVVWQVIRLLFVAQLTVFSHICRKRI
jgi:hypothetical protein